MTFDQMAALVFDLDEALESLPPEIREEYEASQRSIIEARRYAQQHEGWIVIP